MQDEGHPVVGDFKYGSQFDPIGRLALHAYKIEFKHPQTGESVSFTAPYPKDMEATRKQLAKIFGVDPLV